MEIPTLVVSNPPHGDVDLDAAASLLGLDVFATRLKVKFRAPEVLAASEPGDAAEFAASLSQVGFTVFVLPGSALADLPWPDPVTNVVFDASALRATTPSGSVRIPYDAEVVAVVCQPPADFSMKPTVDLGQAVKSGHGPTIAEALQWIANLDLYFLDAGKLRRVSIVPTYCQIDANTLLAEIQKRFQKLHLDTRLAGVRPRQRFVMGETGFDPDLRKRYSYGTLLLRHVLESIAPELRDVPQFELGSRLGLALSSLGRGGT